MFVLLLWSAIFIISLYALIKASDFFIDAAEKISLLFGIPKYIVGVTIVSMGTSLPELITSLAAVYHGAPEIVVGNVVGSNIANILLIMGLAAVAVKEIRIGVDVLGIALPLLLGSALLFAIAAWDGDISRGEALLLVGGFIIFIFYAISQGNDRKNRRNPGNRPSYLQAKPFLVLAASAVGIYFGANYTIEAVIVIADTLHLGKELVAVSAIAVGTSLPELSVTISAVRKNNPEIAFGNVLGSNLFNTFAVIGFPGVWHRLPVSDSLLIMGTPVMVIATFLFIIVTQDRHVTRWEGWLFLLVYVFFIGKIFNFL